MKTITCRPERSCRTQEAAIGWVDDEASTDGLRNSGKTRTPAKREMLARIENKSQGCWPPAFEVELLSSWWNV
jgi:hypothetical protein